MKRRHGLRFRIVVTHDAEDLDPSRFAPADQLLLPPLRHGADPGAAPAHALREFTHGLYCDEFAEYQRKDIPVRQALGGFLPSNGVGTGFDRGALEHLAATRRGRPFDPACLTEDYETGYRLHALGYAQIFVPLRIDAGGPGGHPRIFSARRCAPPFPSAPAGSPESRCRAGNTTVGRRAPALLVLARSQRHRRKSAFPTREHAASLWSGELAVVGHGLSAALPPWLGHTCLRDLAIAVVQTSARAQSAASIYGWRFAALVPLRVLWGNLVNFAATATALWEFFDSRWAVRAWRGAKQNMFIQLPHRLSLPVRLRIGNWR